MADARVHGVVLRGRHLLLRGDPAIGLASLVPLCVALALVWREQHRISPAIAAFALLLAGAAAALAAVPERAFSEWLAGLVYGPGVLLGTLLLFGAAITKEAIAASLVLGILAAVVVLAHEMPEQRRTLVERVGRDVAATLIAILFAVAFAIPILLVAYGGSLYFAGALAGAPTSYIAYVLLRREFDRVPIAARVCIAITYVVTGLGLVLGAIVV